MCNCRFLSQLRNGRLALSYQLHSHYSSWRGILLCTVTYISSPQILSCSAESLGRMSMKTLCMEICFATSTLLLIFVATTQMVIPLIADFSCHLQGRFQPVQLVVSVTLLHSCVQSLAFSRTMDTKTLHTVVLRW